MDYKKLGLKCGIEIHQELNTRKLFCNCPSKIRDDEPDIVIHRKMRAVAGETGEIDVAAAHEMAKGRTYIYQAYRDSTCNVELDEEPPMPMDDEALKVALQVSLMLKADVVDEIQVMRKTVVDGSNTSGFQRTALVARKGMLETSEGEVRIPTIMIEEDAARIISRDKDSVTYRLDRLGIPLIEIGTEPDIHSPEQAKEAAEKLGMMLRSTGKSKRGLGTIRQDVNVSIKGGRRIEIKGAQDLRLIPKLVQIEVERQLSLIEISKSLGSRISIKKGFTDVSGLLENSGSKIIRACFRNKGVVYALRLPGFSGLLGKEISPDRRLGTELSERAKVKAGVGGIFHSDELPAYGITEEEKKAIALKLGCSKDDGFAIVADQKPKAEKALQAIAERAGMCAEGVPKEVRKANQDGTTSFLRPMPGAARLYPETDVVPIRPDTKDVKIPELITQKAEKFREKLNLGKDLADKLARSDRRELIEDLINRFSSIKPAFIAETVLSTTKEIKRKFDMDVDSITDEQYEEIFGYLDKGKISKDVIMDVLIDYARGKFRLEKYEMLSDQDLEKEVRRILDENKDLEFKKVMGVVMGKLKGKASGRKIAEIVRKLT